jgi:hypothetical protein
MEKKTFSFSFYKKLSLSQGKSLFISCERARTRLVLSNVEKNLKEKEKLRLLCD